jgi:type IV fimbrial biogenesis protein FimT
MRPLERNSGFSLIEVAVAITIFAILVAMTVPSMKTWIANAKVRAVADSLQNGVRMAQAESLRRSRQVVFALTTSTTPQNGYTASDNGNYWAISLIPAMTDGTETATYIEGGVLGSDSSANVTITGPAEICFNSVGRLVANAATGVAGGNCATPAVGNPPKWNYDISMQGTVADHPLRVEVGLGGQTHLCDRSQTLSSSNPYGCTP